MAPRRGLDASPDLATEHQGAHVPQVARENLALQDPPDRL